MSCSHYAALGLDRDFSLEQLRKRYRALALRWHPDRNRGNEAYAAEKFRMVQEAFEVLCDARSRRVYDVELVRRRARDAASAAAAAAVSRQERASTDQTSSCHACGRSEDPQVPAQPASATPGYVEPPMPALPMRKTRSEETQQRRSINAALASNELKSGVKLRPAFGASGDYDDVEDADIADAEAAVEAATRHEIQEADAARRAVEAAKESRKLAATVARSKQLAALMQLGFPPEVAMPICDGVSDIDVLVEQMLKLRDAFPGSFAW